MIRTRDLILFVLVLLFLIVAIGQSVLFSSKDEVSVPQKIDFIADTSIQSAFGDTSKIDRDANLARLKEKISSATKLVTPSPSVESSVVSVSDTSITQNNTVRGVQKCLYPDDSLALVPRWPLKNVTLDAKERVRLVSEQIIQKIPTVLPTATGTTSSSTMPKEQVVQVSRTLLQLPLSPIKNATVSCVPSEVIGVATGGLLIFNGDVNSYRKIPENALIGYARDGFPIYGVYDGEVDACGGYDSPTGYRYTISAERDYIVGCYVGAPQKFSL